MNWLCSWQPYTQLNVSYKMRVSKGNVTKKNVVYRLYQNVHCPPTLRDLWNFTYSRYRFFYLITHWWHSTINAFTSTRLSHWQSIMLLMSTGTHPSNKLWNRVFHLYNMIQIDTVMVVMTSIQIFNVHQAWMKIINTFYHQAASVLCNAKLICSYASIWSSIWSGNVI